MAQSLDKTQLIADLAQARAELSRNIGALRRDLDFPSHAKKSFTRHPLPWLGGAGLLGLIISRLSPRRAPKTNRPIFERPLFKRPVEPALEKAGKAGLLLGVLKMVLDFARPAITAWGRKRVADYIATRQTVGKQRR